ncbi:pyruvate kinase [Propionibacterium australiense]|uniref:Pyruvate kinase n=1 Tax=Propionibacterium australiense TaxID=119981 RepID=A0A8B3FK90_9ACTN|nr:pyruvate kinase [Propionibacterium australiense]RLP11164.1 pyruvate kinase [Propionibacterium australiense]RLP12493.1 pyruvate kinase [Propionibacterium australiense]
MRRAKIVCTLGPATSTQERMEEIIRAGLDVARFNMSHGDHDEHARRLAETRAASEAVGKTVGLLADLQGPKIRLGVFAEGKVELTHGQTFTITTDDVLGDANRASTTYKGLPGDVRPGDRILIDDGNIGLEAVEVNGNDVVTKVTVAGPVSNHKGINLPGVAVNVPAMSEKDEDDLRWALRNDFDMIALSFVRRASDVNRVHEIMDEEGVHIPVIAKLEKPQAIENLDEIIDAFDGFMVARGDLGVEMPLEQVPLVQKTIIKKARMWAKPVIVATQMLDSMISNPRPTRAEASDVANAVLDGADAVMLSGETSVGAFPVITVQTMANIVENTEKQGFENIAKIDWDPHTTGGVIAMAAATSGRQLDAKYLIAFTQSGDTASRMSRLRSDIPLLAFTPDEKTARWLTLCWGARVIQTPSYGSNEEMVTEVNRQLQELKLAEEGDVVILVCGAPMGIKGKTNTMRVHRLKDISWVEPVELPPYMKNAT